MDYTLPEKTCLLIKLRHIRTNLPQILDT